MNTLHELCRQLDVPLWRLDYIVRSRGIEPIRKFGNTRVYDDTAAELIRQIILAKVLDSERIHPVA